MTPLSPNTQAILMLMAPMLAGGGARDVQLLKPLEYRGFAARLFDAGQQPGSLLGEDAMNIMHLCRGDLGLERLQGLLDRGFQLGQALNKWADRGIWVISRADTAYPGCLKSKLKERRPALLFGCGNPELLTAGGLAMVGSRNVSPAELEWTRKTAGDCANNNHALVSGGARGVDQAAMLAALDAGGLSIGVLADGLSKAAIARVYRYALREQRLVLVSPYDPDARFMVGHAMERNKFIYALAHAGLVVQTDLDKGGTWAGAKEQLDRFRCGAVYVRADDRSPGAAGLRAKGAENWPDQPVDWQAVFAQQKPTQATAATVQEVEVSYGASLDSDEKLLLRILEQPQGIRQIVSILNCPQSEVTPLLKKLENQEKIERNKRTKKYVVVSKTLF